MMFASKNRMKIHTLIRKIGVILSALLLITIVIVSAVFIKYSPIGIILCIFFLFYISYKLNLFKSFEVPAEVTRKNSSVDAAKDEIKKLLSTANNSVIISSGSFSEIIWGSDQIIQTLDSLIRRGVQVYIITVNRLKISKNSPLYKFLKANMEKYKIFFYSKEIPPDAHFVVVDGSSVRLEERHTENTKVRKALIKYNRASLAGRAKNKFERLKIGSQIVSPEYLETIINSKEA